MARNNKEDDLREKNPKQPLAIDLNTLAFRRWRSKCCFGLAGLGVSASRSYRRSELVWLEQF